MSRMKIHKLHDNSSISSGSAKAKGSICLFFLYAEQSCNETEHGMFGLAQYDVVLWGIPSVTPSLVLARSSK